MPLIEVSRLTKVYQVPLRQPGFTGAALSLVRPSYKAVTAVDGIDFTIQAGEMVGYIGPNGAGKSTTIKLLCGVLAPTSGSVSVGGLDPHRRRMENARRIGLVYGQRSQLLWDLPVRETFYLLRRIYQVPESTYRENLADFGRTFEIDAVWDTPVRLLSLGQRMRAELAAALIHSPPIVYLDEPTIGLDVLAKSRIREFLRQMNRRRGTTVILTTHDLRDVEEVCDRIIMIHQGRLVYDGALEGLRGTFGERCTLTLELEEAAGGAVAPEVALDDDVRLIKADGKRVELAFDRRRISAPEVIARACAVLPVRDLVLRETDLESVVKQVYGGNGIENGNGNGEGRGGGEP